MKDIKPLIYDFYASVILRRLIYCDNKSEVINFYRNNLLPGFVKNEGLRLNELRKGFDNSKNYKLETLVQEIDKTIN